jgi:small subunit ribosomal protein S20
MTRESPVAAEKIAVDQASRRDGKPVASPRASLTAGSPRREHTSGPRWYHGARPRSGHFHVMANIKQQKKRVRSAARQRLENLRYRSTVKTLTRRLRSAVDEGNADSVRATHVELQRWIDRAAAHGALHRNAAARKKAQAARIVSGE